MGILEGCIPRKDVLKGDLDDAIFAADFGDLIAGRGPKVYKDPHLFFQNTHPAKQLCKIAEVVFGRLANAKEEGATLRLSTGFGGGKTHTLMALWHLGQKIEDPKLGIELLPAAGRPKSVTVVGVDAAKAGVPQFGSHGAIKTHSLWGEIFLALGGEKAFRSLGKADDPEASPSEHQIEAIFPKGPVLILLDEIVIYMAKLSERGQGNLLGFLNSLASVVRKRPQSVLVVTDPAGQAAYATHAVRLGDALLDAAKKLDEVFGRKMSDFDPIKDESAQVIVRRLFDNVDQPSAQAASATYHSLYERVAQDSPDLLPKEATTAEFSKRFVQCYPFHPRLLDTARDRLGALQDFQKSRGVLRLFARILRDVWDDGNDYEIISAGEINWSSARIQADLLQRLNRDSFKSAVSADIEKHATELDGDAPRGVHCRTASALLLESLPMQENSGLDAAGLTFAVLRPEEAGPEPSEALDRLVGTCWHTYQMAGGRGWQFRYEPNVIKQIEERKNLIPVEDAKSAVLAEAQKYFSGPSFKLAPWPANARQVSESAELQLVLCEDEKTTKNVCANSDDSNPSAPLPRRFQNAILGVTTTQAAFDNAIERARRLLAAEAIEKENRTGDAGKLVREQLQRLKPEFQKQFRIQTCRSFDRIVLATGSVYRLEEQFQVSEEQMLQKPQGQSCLLKFLDSNTLIYKAGESVDALRFVRDVLPGSTPEPDKPGVYTARSIHERFLAAPNLRLIPDGSVVRQTILKAIGNGKVVVRLSDGRAYDQDGCVEGPDGKRRRVTGSLTTLSLDDNNYVTETNSVYGKTWTHVDPTGRTGGTGTGGGTPPPPTPGRVTATTWEKLLEFAEKRPLLTLELSAETAASAATLLSLGQPLSADEVKISVTASGALKDGGNMSFAASNVKPTHPAKPLNVAQTVFNSLSEGSVYEAVLLLTFGSQGRTGLIEQLKELSEKAADNIRPSATFDKPMGSA